MTAEIREKYGVTELSLMATLGTIRPRAGTTRVHRIVPVVRRRLGTKIEHRTVLSILGRRKVRVNVRALGDCLCQCQGTLGTRKGDSTISMPGPPTVRTRPRIRPRPGARSVSCSASGSSRRRPPVTPDRLDGVVGPKSSIGTSRLTHCRDTNHDEEGDA